MRIALAVAGVLLTACSTQTAPDTRPQHDTTVSEYDVQTRLHQNVWDSLPVKTREGYCRTFLADPEAAFASFDTPGSPFMESAYFDFYAAHCTAPYPPTATPTR